MMYTSLNYTYTAYSIKLLNHAWHYPLFAAWSHFDGGYMRLSLLWFRLRLHFLETACLLVLLQLLDLCLCFLGLVRPSSHQLLQIGIRYYIHSIVL